MTGETGADPGAVDLQYSTNGGSTWQPIASGVANDGSHTWVVPDEPSSDVRVRVLRPQRTAVPAPYPVDQCSSDASDNSLAISAATALAGSIGDGLRLEKSGALIRLSWAASCAVSADDYAIYEGTLSGLRAGSWDPVPRTCSAGTDLVEEFVPGNGTRYYLVSARAGSAEGSLGADGAGLPRSESALACAPRESDSTCAP